MIFLWVMRLKTKGIGKVSIKTEKTRADMVADLVRAGFLPRAYASRRQEISRTS